MVKIVPAVRLTGQVNIPQSMPLTRRYLICSALSGNYDESLCQNAPVDIESTKKCLTELGIGGEKGPFIGRESFVFDCGQSEWTYRFMLPIAAAMGKDCEFDIKGGSDMSELLKVLRTHGVKSEEVSFGCTRVSGQLTAGTYLLSGEGSDKFVSGLLTALPLLKENSTVIAAGNVRQEEEINMTIQVLKEAGINVTAQNMGGKGFTYKVPGSQTYRLKNPENIEGDWVLASYWLAAGAVSSGTVICGNLEMDSHQVEKRILDLLREFGANMMVSGNSVIAQPGRLKGIMIDADDIHELVPALCVVACAADGSTVIRNAADDPDRLTKISVALNSMGGDVTVIKNGLIINGRGSKGLIGGRADAFEDYGIAMMSAIAAGLCEDAVLLRGAEYAAYAYPSFFDELEKLQQK